MLPPLSFPFLFGCWCFLKRHGISIEKLIKRGIARLEKEINQV
jgi:hypothetical protein